MAGPATTGARRAPAPRRDGHRRRVDHARNGFDPTDILYDFDLRRGRRRAAARRVREYEVFAQDKEIEIAPGLFFPAWTYNGRVPGPDAARDGG